MGATNRKKLSLDVLSWKNSLKRHFFHQTMSHHRMTILHPGQSEILVGCESLSQMSSRWLTPPDGECVGAPPQREYNDFVKSKREQDFWSKSSADSFADPGQDPHKSNRHKLYGQEYWVARPMLMEKFDYEEDMGIPPDEVRGFHLFAVRSFECLRRCMTSTRILIQKFRVTLWKRMVQFRSSLSQREGIILASSTLLRRGVTVPMEDSSSTWRTKWIPTLRQ